MSHLTLPTAVVLAAMLSLAGTAELRIRPAGPPAPEQQRRMGDWHRRYGAAMAPVKAEWLAVLRSARRVGLEHPAARQRLAVRCAGLRRALAGAATEEMLPVPDPVVDLHLRRTLAALRRAARDCDADRLFLLDHRFRGAGRAYLEMARVMRPYAMVP